jgi:glucose-6-phosphate 1-dehydrogenase
MDKFAMIIFGASGDLTKRKLMPALYSLYRDKRLTGDFSILGIGSGSRCDILRRTHKEIRKPVRTCAP